MKIFIETIILAALTTNVCAHSASANTDSFKIRGGFVGANDAAVLPSMAENGLNTAIVWFGEVRSPIGGRTMEYIRQFTEQNGKAGLRLFVVFNFWGEDEKTWFKPKYFYLSGGVEFKNTPCPFSEENYRVLVGDRLLELAKLSKSVSIAGAMIDTEMYGGDVINFLQPCYCDDCWKKYCLEKGESAEVKPQEREEYITRRNKLNDYRAFAVKRLSRLVNETRKETDNIRAGFETGFLLPSAKLYPFTEALARGLGTTDNKVIILSEETYTKGHSKYINEFTKELKYKGIEARFVPGLWQDRISVENLAEQYYYCAKATDGYWIYTLQMLGPNWHQKHVVENRDYWGAIRKANDELDKLELNPDYVSDLKLRPIENVLPYMDYGRIKTGNLMYVKGGFKEALLGEGVRLRRPEVLVFVAEKGEQIRFKLEFGKRVDGLTDYAEATLLSNASEILSTDRATENKPAVLSIIAPYSGSYSIALNPDLNILRVVGFTHPYSIDAKNNVDFIEPRVPLYMWKPAGSNKAKIWYFVNGPGQSVTVSFRDESGNFIGKYDIMNRQTLELPLPTADKEQVIIMEIKPRPNTCFEDVFVKVENGLGRFISPWAEGLVKYDYSTGR